MHRCALIYKNTRVHFRGNDGAAHGVTTRNEYAISRERCNRINAESNQESQKDRQISKGKFGFNWNVFTLEAYPYTILHYFPLILKKITFEKQLCHFNVIFTYFIVKQERVLNTVPLNFKQINLQFLLTVIPNHDTSQK